MIHLNAALSFSGMPARAGSPTADEQRLREAAQEFEASLIHSWWRSMRESFGSGEAEGMESKSGVLEDLSSHAMASAVTKAGGIGFSKLLLQRLQQETNAQEAVPKKAGLSAAREFHSH